ncbi:transposase [Streptomyces sp. NPDC093982]|uniref:transposase n=1 Tax=Streptomyces sp. NPDC093982 TaxID=3155077 RepID=UPI0034424A96
MGPDTAAQLLITAGADLARLRTEASFAALCGAAPVPASSGKTNRHRLSRGGETGRPTPLSTASRSCEWPDAGAPASSSPDRPAPDERRRKSSGSSNAR